MTPKLPHGGAVRAAIFAVAALTLGAGLASGTEGDYPAWAYPRQPPLPPAPADAPKPVPDPTLRHVPDSKLEMTLRQSEDPHNAPDWHPEDHPPAPDLIFHGRPPHLEACAHCHLPNGLGTTIIQAPGLAGLPAEYMLQQMADMKSGTRKSARQPGGPTGMMAFIVKDADEADLKVAADYFASLAPKPWFRVVESATVPATTISGPMYVAVDGPPEPLGERIIELPEDMARTELRDSRSGFVAYVPVGSIKRGEVLVTTGGKGTTLACTGCHGADLHGLGPVPSIAGRSPSYIVRQLNDIQHGARAGVWSALMKPVVAKLTTADMVAIAAYTASREP